MTAADVLVIGSGAGGGSVAYGLAQRGVSVLVLEAGPAYDPATDYRLHRDDWERGWFPSKADEDASYSIAPLQPLDLRRDKLRSWSAARGRFNPTGRRMPGRYHHVQGVGGSTLHFLAEADRLPEATMNLQSRFGVAADWPVSAEELAPFYDEAERVAGIAGSSGRAGQQTLGLPPHALSHASTRIAAGCRRLGLTLEPGPVAILSEPRDGRPACNYCGNCIRGCPISDKGSVDVTFLAQAQQTGRCEVRPRSQVLRIEPGPGDRVRSVTYADSAGLLAEASARVVVVACGAVHSPRLLLASAGRHAPDGLGNESGQVGRNFMETLGWSTTALHPDRLGSHRGLPSDAACLDFARPDAVPGVIGGFRLTAGSGQAGLQGPVSYARHVVPGWGREHKRAMREAFGRALTVAGIAECLPSPGSYIDLDPERSDRHGLPLARIHSSLDDMAARRMTYMADRCREILAASGCGDPVVEHGSYDIFNSTHVMGTCRMGPVAGTSVVDPTCRSHRWRNLYVVDASVFPSSGGGFPPSLTIEALALRAARIIAERLGRGD